LKVSEYDQLSPMTGKPDPETKGLTGNPMKGGSVGNDGGHRIPAVNVRGYTDKQWWSI